MGFFSQAPVWKETKQANAPNHDNNRLFGFFFGSTLAGGAVYYYALQEYKASNELLTEDIYVGSWIYIQQTKTTTNNSKMGGTERNSADFFFLSET